MTHRESPDSNERDWVNIKKMKWSAQNSELFEFLTVFYDNVEFQNHHKILSLKVLFKSFNFLKIYSK